MLVFHFYLNICLLLNAVLGNGQTSAQGMGSLQEKEPDQLLQHLEPFYTALRYPRKWHSSSPPMCTPSEQAISRHEKSPVTSLSQALTRNVTPREGSSFKLVAPKLDCPFILLDLDPAITDLPFTIPLCRRIMHGVCAVSQHSPLSATERSRLLQTSSLYHTEMGCQMNVKPWELFQVLRRDGGGGADL